MPSPRFWNTCFSPTKREEPTQLTLEKPGGLEEFGRPRRGSQVVEQAGRGVGVIDGEFAGESVQQIARRGWKGAGRREDVGQVVAQPHDLGARVRRVGDESGNLAQAFGKALAAPW